MNEELLTVIRSLAMRSLNVDWYEPYALANHTGNNDAEFIAAMSPELALDLVYEIERRFAIQAELLALRDKTNDLQLALETERDAANLYAKQVAHWIEKHDALLAQQMETKS